jgi:thioredoxin 1
LFEAPVTLADSGSQELNQNLPPVIQGPLTPAQAEPVSFNAAQSVVKQSTEQRGDAKSQTTPRRVEHVNDHSFEQMVLDSDQAVLVDFYADWCAPCKKLSPLLDELAQEMPDVRIVKVNIDRSPESARSYRVKSLPTLILFKGGKPVARRGGLLNKGSLKKLVGGSS